MFKTKKQNKTKTNSSDNKHPSCHYAQTLWMLKKMPLLAKKKKKYASYYLKMCKNAISFFCKILQFIVIYKCKLWYKLTFL